MCQGSVSGILDLGCGEGRNTLYTLFKGIYTCALDISPGCLERVDKAARSLRLRGLLDLLVADVSHMPFRDECFEAILDSYLYTFIRDRESYAYRIAKMLKAGGKLLLEYDMSPHVLPHARLLALLAPFDRQLVQVSLELLYHEWGDVGNEELEQVPAISALYVAPLSQEKTC